MQTKLLALRSFEAVREVQAPENGGPATNRLIATDINGCEVRLDLGWTACAFQKYGVRAHIWVWHPYYGANPQEGKFIIVADLGIGTTDAEQAIISLTEEVETPRPAHLVLNLEAAADVVLRLRFAVHFQPKDGVSREIAGGFRWMTPGEPFRE